MTSADLRIQRGMQIQLSRRKALLDGGVRPLGWKIGFGSPQAMARLGTEAALVGFMTYDNLLESGATVSIGEWTEPVAETELAVHMGRDLAPGSTQQAARLAIASIAPAIELADLHFPPDDIEAILSDNIYHRHVILGEADLSRAGGDIAGLTGRVLVDGDEFATTTDMQTLTGNLIQNVCHVADLLAAFDLGLQAGDVIIAGAIVPPIHITPDSELVYVLDPVGQISASFKP